MSSLFCSLHVYFLDQILEGIINDLLKTKVFKVNETTLKIVFDIKGNKLKH